MNSKNILSWCKILLVKVWEQIAEISEKLFFSGKYCYVDMIQSEYIFVSVYEINHTILSILYLHYL